MASNKARGGRLSPRAMVMWLVIMMPAVSASQSHNISQTQSKQHADSNTLDAPLAHISSWQGNPSGPLVAATKGQRPEARGYERVRAPRYECAMKHCLALAEWRMGPN